MEMVIYGAQAIALGAYKAIKEIFPVRNVRCFLVTELGNNAATLAGLPVCELIDFTYGMSQEEKDNVEVLIATPENVMVEIEKSLNEVGLHCHVRLDSVRWAQMQQLTFIKSGKYMPLTAYPIGFHESTLRVYKAKFYRDKELSTRFTNPDYMIDLQVGAARTMERVATLLDNDADNISEKNGNYSELTGLYWIWKNKILTADNCKDKYFGLVHYRRVFDLSNDDLLRIRDNEIDAILPYPMPYEPNIEVHHKRYLTETEWNAVLHALEELQPEYAEVFKEILTQEYMYNYNIIIAKGNVLSDYCSWLFPILFRVEELNDPDGAKEPNRFIGYVGETLETLYFMYNRQKLRIAHAGCRFLL